LSLVTDHSSRVTPDPSPRTEQILGVRFFNGSSREAVAQIAKTGGMVSAPAAPSMVALRYDQAYRNALAIAEFAIADSGWMVLLWKLFTGRRVERISGLEYVKRLLEHPSLRPPEAALWIVPSESAGAKLLRFLEGRGLGASERNVYVAPRYAVPVEDQMLLQRVSESRPAHIVVGVGGGNQDKLGQFLIERLQSRPAIHCIGAAIGFLTGDQVAVPPWADRFYLGWMLRLLAQPRVFIPRFWTARELPWLLWKYRDAMPPLVSNDKTISRDGEAHTARVDRNS
jgi:UDP-N-acetyl-D-mannosaminuronic acid transferase (WecB/TagA/CpsF family)